MNRGVGACETHLDVGVLDGERDERSGLRRAERPELERSRAPRARIGRVQRPLDARGNIGPHERIRPRRDRSEREDEGGEGAKAHRAKLSALAGGCRPGEED